MVDYILQPICAVSQVAIVKNISIIMGILYKLEEQAEGLTDGYQKGSGKVDDWQHRDTRTYVHDFRIRKELACVQPCDNGNITQRH